MKPLALLMAVFALTCIPIVSAHAATDCALSAGPGYSTGGFRYVLSSGRLRPDEDAVSKVRTEFGPNAALADWLDLKKLLASRETAIDFFNGVGIRSQPRNNECDEYFVTVAGALSDSEGRRFFIARHDGVVPDDWAVLDDVGNHLLDLGRWNYPSQAVVKVALSSTSESPKVAAVEQPSTPSATPPHPPPRAEHSPSNRADFPFYEGVINGTIDSLTGQDTSNAEMVGGISEKDIQAACSKDPVAWTNERDCVKALMVLTKRSSEKLDTQYDDLAIKDRGFTFTKANADCGDRKLTIWRKDKPPQEYVATVDDRYYWRDKASNRPIHDFLTMVRSGPKMWTISPISMLCFVQQPLTGYTE